MQQYVWRELVVIGTDGKPRLIDEPVSPRDETAYKLTTNISRKVWHHDVTTRLRQRYECSTLSLTSFTCSDQPSPAYDYIEIKNPARMVSLAHFETFFVLDGKACAHVSWFAKHDWREGSAYVPNWAGHYYILHRNSETVDTGATIDDLLREIKKAAAQWNDLSNIDGPVRGREVPSPVIKTR